MEITEHIEALSREGRLLAASASAAGPDAHVPSCPGWDVRELVRHQGGVHRWATDIVATPRTEPWRVGLDEVVGTWPGDAELISWFGEGVDRLVAALSGASPELECWTFLAAPSPLAMWARRQAHETAVHRVDAELAAGSAVTPVSAPFASDGISELLTCFITRPRGTLRADPERTLRVRCDDVPGDWLVRIAADRVVTTVPGEDGFRPDADCTVSGPAEDLYLTLWNRRQRDGLPVAGDHAVLDLFLDQVHIRWT